MPRERAPDSTLALIRDPYTFIRDRCLHHRSDAFEARILLQPTICLTGHEAAALFYDERRIVRSGAAPRRLERTLFGSGGVQGLDGAAHRHRKAAFTSLVTAESVDRLGRIAFEEWEAEIATWPAESEVRLYDRTRVVLTRTACRWAGVPLPRAEEALRTEQLTLLFDSAAAVGPRHWLARRARVAADAWAAGVIKQARAGELPMVQGTALHVIARHRDEQGSLLAPPVAGVELLNVLRPTVAVSVFICHLARALAIEDGWRERLRQHDETADLAFIEEVRRHSPFFPAVAGRVRDEFTWHGMSFPAGRRVLLDLYGTLHDPRLWPAPESFDPDRNRPAEQSRFTFIPQSGGDSHQGHRCPGEPIAVRVMQVALEFLARRLDWSVDASSLRLSMRRLPPVPRHAIRVRVAAAPLAAIEDGEVPWTTQSG